MERKKLFCNKCGKELDFWDGQINFRVVRYLGYGTKYDGKILDLKMCCSCIEELVDACANTPLRDDVEWEDEE